VHLSYKPSHLSIYVLFSSLPSQLLIIEKDGGFYFLEVLI
jgi:hypothetical protein